MTPSQTAKAIDSVWSGHVTASNCEPPIGNALDFQLVSAARCSVETLQEINDFLDTQDTSHPFQWPQWSGNRALLALLRRHGHVRWFAECGALYPAGRFLRPIRALTVNRGPVCDDLDLIETGLRHLITESRKRRIAYIDIAPEWTGTLAERAVPVLVRAGWQMLSGGRRSLRLDLRPSSEQLLAAFRKATRYEIRRADSQGVVVTMVNDESAHRDFFQLYSEMATEKNFVPEDPVHLRDILRWLARKKDRGGLLVARKDGKIMGGILIVRSGTRCWYLLGATSRHDKVSAGHLLHWHAIQWSKEHGCLEYDFSGGEYRPGADPGTAFFKQGFCENLVQFLPPHRYILIPARLRVCDFVRKFRAGCGLD